MFANYIDKNIFEIATISGIYTIINRKNKRFYIGESLNIEKRRKQHFDNLLKNKHSNTDLQYDFNKYGEESFEFKVLQPYIGDGSIFTKIDLLILENAYINYYKDRFNLYNKEDSLNRILSGGTIEEIQKRYAIIFKKYLVDRLLTTDIIYIDDHPGIIEVDTIQKYYYRKNMGQNKMMKIRNAIPEGIFNQCVKEKHVDYVNHKGEKVRKINLQIVQEEPLLSWLVKNRGIKLDRILDEERNLLGAPHIS